jgi:hypothetical protein
MMRLPFIPLAIAAVAMIPMSPSIAEVHRPWCADYGHGVNCGLQYLRAIQDDRERYQYVVRAESMVLAIRFRRALAPALMMRACQHLKRRLQE